MLYPNPRQIISLHMVPSLTVRPGGKLLQGNGAAACQISLLSEYLLFLSGKIEISVDKAHLELLMLNQRDNLATESRNQMKLDMRMENFQFLKVKRQEKAGNRAGGTDGEGLGDLLTHEGQLLAGFLKNRIDLGCLYSQILAFRGERKTLFAPDRDGNMKFFFNSF